MRVTILRTNDIHGRIEGLARVRDARGANPGGDAAPRDLRRCRRRRGDDHATLQPHEGRRDAPAPLRRRLRGVGGRQRGLAALGPQVVADQARAANYPLLLANLSPVGGVRPTTPVDGVGFVGVTAPFHRFLETGLTASTSPTRSRRCAAERASCASRARSSSTASRTSATRSPRRATGRLATPSSPRKCRANDLIVGAHTHHLLPEGHRVGSVPIVQARSFAEHLRRVDVEDGEIRVSTLDVGEDVALHPAVLAAAAAAEADLDASLDEIVAELETPLDPRWIAEMLRERMDAEIGLATSAAVFDYPLPAGSLRRGDL